jgi:hypothetical protein
MPRKVAAPQLTLELSSLNSPTVNDLPESRGEAHNDPLAEPRKSGTGRVAATRPHKAHAAKHRPPSAQLLRVPGALLTRSDLRELGLERRAIDAVFRTLSVVALPGYSRPMIRADEYYALIDASTYRDDRVRPRHA